MDVAFLTDGLSRGGAETQMVRLAVGLRQRGWDVGVLTLLPSTAYLEDLEAAGIPVAECAGGFPGMAFRLVRQLRAWRPRTLVTFNFPADMAGRFCGRLAGVDRILATLRTSRVKNRLRGLAYRWTQPMVAMTVSNAQGSLDRMFALRYLKAKRTLVIPNGLHLQAHQGNRPEMRAGLKVPPDAFLWVAVGNTTPAKDYPNLLAAATRLPGEFRLAIAGGGPALEALRKASPDPRVQFLGPRSDVPALLAAADGFVLASAWEGLPNAVMEAMAAGLPVVATDVGGVRDLVVPDTMGWIVPPGDPAKLAERMEALMAMGPARRRDMGEAGRGRIVQCYAMDRIVDQWEALLEG